MNWKRYRARWLSAGLSAAFGIAVAQGGEPSRAEVFAKQDHAAPGAELTLGLRIVLDEGWHTYWSNPGDSGMAPLVTWIADVPLESGPLLHPPPRRFDEQGMVTFGHASEVLLVTDVRLPDTLPGDSLTLRCEAQWLVCHDVCIPQTATMELTLPVRRTLPATEDSKAADPRFAAFRTVAPAGTDGYSLSASEQDGRVLLRVRDTTGGHWDGASFFPFGTDQVGVNRLEDWQRRPWGGWLVMERSELNRGTDRGWTLSGLLRLEYRARSRVLWLPVEARVGQAPADADDTATGNLNSLE